MTKQKVDAKAWLLLIALSIIWGSSFILIKKGLIAFNFMQVGALRILLSALVVAPFAYSYVAGFLIYKTAFNKNKFIGVLIGLAGAFVIIILGNDPMQSQNSYYAFYIVLASFCYANSVNIIKKYLNTTNPIAITSYSFLFIALPALIIFLFTNPVQTFETEPQVWMSLGALVLLSFIGTAFANYLFFNLTQKTSAIFASSVTYLIPIVALFWGIYDGEVVNLTQLTGMLLILVGVWVTSR